MSNHSAYKWLNYPTVPTMCLISVAPGASQGSASKHLTTQQKTSAGTVDNTALHYIKTMLLFHFHSLFQKLVEICFPYMFHLSSLCTCIFLKFLCCHFKGNS